ncbi:kelch-like protein 10 [Salarias fasciatus]|uniref:kelch-like protein 10 n=1 Tax=Salarias fasciatus TaxID=181472 RepID=UPI001176BE01|nr:kelch-like protein 10 [Salarias fasciatus]
MSAVYEELRSAGTFCDAVLKVQDAEFQIHKVILCECSPYFEALFVRWSSPNQRDYDIQGITPVIMELIIKFAYTGSAHVTADNVQGLMVTANQFEIMDVVQTCSRVLEEQLCPENCISIWKFIRFYSISNLHPKVYRYILDQFEKVISSEQLQQLTVHEFAHFLERDGLIVRAESMLYEAIMTWIGNDPDQRKGHLCYLMSKIRLCLMRMRYIMVTVLSNDLVKNDSQCLAMVTKASRMLHYLYNNFGGSTLSNPFVRPRLPSAILFATGGITGDSPIDSVEAYDIRLNRWLTFTLIAEPRSYHGTAFLNGSIYYIGGYSGEGFSNRALRFNPAMKTFQEVAPMHTCRCYVTVTVLKGLIYALGGFDGQMRLSSSEHYQPESNQWTLIAPMRQSRSDAGCAVLHEKIYVFGGFDGWDCLQTAECYDPQTNQWTVISNMSSPRSQVGAAASKNLAYVVGGFDGNNCLASAEVYDPRTDTWSVLPSMITRRCNFGIEVLDDCIFVVGGSDSFRAIRAVERFDPVQNLWFDVCDLHVSRRAVSCCVVYGLPNMEDYTLIRDSLPFFQLDQEMEKEEREDKVPQPMSMVSPTQDRPDPHHGPGTIVQGFYHSGQRSQQNDILHRQTRHNSPCGGPP